MTSAAKGLAQMGVNCAVLTEVKITNKKVPQVRIWV